MTTSRASIRRTPSTIAFAAWAPPRVAGQQPTQPPAQPPAGQQDPQKPEQQKPPTFKTAINFVRVDVIVSDDKGNPVLDLKQDEFTVSEDGSDDLLVYHARNYKEIVGDPLYDPNRHTRVQPFGWNSDGTPWFGVPVPDSRDTDSEENE